MPRTSKYIMLSAEYGMGTPVVRGTNIKTDTLKSYHRGGDSIALIANLFDLTIPQVKAALRCKWKAIPIKEMKKYWAMWKF